MRFAKREDIDGDVLIIDATRTKTGIEHRVPLSIEAQQVIALVDQREEQAFLFPSPIGKAMSDATMSRFMGREGYTARPHGFRATFRTRVEEMTDTPYEVKEAALGHVVDSSVVRAYQRSDRLDKLRMLMQQWADFLKGDRQ